MFYGFIINRKHYLTQESYILDFNNQLISPLHTNFYSFEWQMYWLRLFGYQNICSRYFLISYRRLFILSKNLFSAPNYIYSKVTQNMIFISFGNWEKLCYDYENLINSCHWAIDKWEKFFLLSRTIVSSSLIFSFQNLFVGFLKDTFILTSARCWHFFKTKFMLHCFERFDTSFSPKVMMWKYDCFVFDDAARGLPIMTAFVQM